MRNSIIVAVLTGLLSLFLVPMTAAPAVAQSAVHCKTYVSDVKWSTPPAKKHLYADLRQTCTGGYAWHQVKGMIQKYVVRNNAPDGWVTVAQNQERAYQPHNTKGIKVKYYCNDRAPKRTFRADGTFTMQTPKGTPGGRSVRSMYELKAYC